MLNLAEYRARPGRLADLLPWGFLVASGVVLNKDGSFQRTARFRGPDLESATDAGLVAACARVNNVLRRFGSGWALFFEAARVPVRAYPRSEFPDPLSAAVDAQRRRAFEAEGRHHESACHLTLLYLPPAEAWSRAGDALLERPPEEGPAPSWARHLETFRTETERAFGLLAEVMPEVEPLDDAATLAFLHAAVSPRGGRVAVPEIPAHLDAVLADAELAGGLEPRLDGLHLRTLGVLGFPGVTRPGLLDELNDLAFPYRWTTRFLALDKEEAARALRRYERQWFAKRKSVLALVREVMFGQETPLVDSDAANKAADADAALQGLGEDLFACGHLTTTVSVLDRTREGAEERMLQVERVLHGRGFRTIRERLNAVEAWLSSLPGHAYANVRQPVVHTLNLAHMMPLSAVWAGPARNAHLDGPPLLVARTRGTTPFRLSLHVGDVGHTMVVGPTGAGKSVLLAMLCLQFRRYPGAQVTVFDRGASCRAAVLGMGGSFVDLGAGEGGPAFQPLARVDGEGERVFAQTWTVSLLESAGVEVDAGVREKVWRALGAVAGMPGPERTLTAFASQLGEPALRDALGPWLLGGPHGRLLDAERDDLDFADVQGFETEHLLERKGVAGAVLAHVFHRLDSRLDGRPALLVLDEAWAYLDDPMFAGRIRAWLKTLRKRNAAVVFATQSLADVAESPVAPTLVDSCPSRIFLPNERAEEPGARAAYARFGLSDRQVQIIATAVPKRDYYYQSRRGSRLFDLELSPEELVFAGASSPESQRLVDRALAAAGDDPRPGAFARAFLDLASGARPARRAA